ncbi:RDD family protein [Emticicia sp. BO119]|uniref:RDD family protein n=1 Tax=Emticicia sp. BO119 TaxID=2757768 RepID=UPI0015F031FD|nr:RDD family protein [Emticicia sp. BO119]MBA4852645.1 RDD family protein [Emticicia sp. BO119]
MKAIFVPTYLNIDLKFELAHVGTRFGAYLIDWIIKCLYLVIVSSATSITFGGSSVLLSFFIYLPLIFYSFFFEWLNKGQSLGKYFLKIRVVGIDGNYPSIYQCAVRWLFLGADTWLIWLFVFIHVSFYFFALFSPLIGGLLIILTEKHQRFGDMAANTVVINTRQKEIYIEDTIYAYATKNKGYEPKYPEIMRLSDKDINQIKFLLERGSETLNPEIANKLAKHIKNLLKIESTDNNYDFLKQLLNDYNYYAINEVK